MGKRKYRSAAARAFAFADCLWRERYTLRPRHHVVGGCTNKFDKLQRITSKGDNEIGFVVFIGKTKVGECYPRAAGAWQWHTVNGQGSDGFSRECSSKREAIIEICEAYRR